MSATTPRTPSARPPRQLHVLGAQRSDTAPELGSEFGAPEPEPLARGLQMGLPAPAADRPEVRRLEVERARAPRTVPQARTRPGSPGPVGPADSVVSIGSVQLRRGFVPVYGAAPSIPAGPAPERELLLPNVLIAGVSHAGAVQLAADLGGHPQIVLPGVKRIGHFTPLRYGRPIDVPLDEYDRHFARWSGQRYRLEAGPDYFDGGPSMVRRVAGSLPGARVVVVLRDPAQRLWASYADKLARGRVPRAMGFESYVDRCLALRSNGSDRFEGNRHFRTLSSGFYVEYLAGWLEAFGRRARVVFAEDLRDHRADQVGGLLDWLGLDRHAAAPLTEDLIGEGYGLAEHAAAPARRRWWPIGQGRSGRAARPASDGGTPELHGTGPIRRMPRQSERTLADVRALYGQANADLAVLLRDLGYCGLPDWLAGGPLR